MLAGAAEADPLARQQLVVPVLRFEQVANLPGELSVPVLGRGPGRRIEPVDSLPELICQAQLAPQEGHEFVHSDPLLQALANLLRQLEGRGARSFELLPVGSSVTIGGGCAMLHQDRQLWGLGGCRAGRLSDNVTQQIGCRCRRHAPHAVPTGPNRLLHMGLEGRVADQFGGREAVGERCGAGKGNLFPLAEEHPALDPPRWGGSGIDAKYSGGRELVARGFCARARR